MSFAFRTLAFTYIILLCTGCSDRFPPPKGPEGSSLVLNGFWEPDSTPAIRLQRTFEVGTSGSETEISGAIVQLLENGIPAASFAELQPGNYAPVGSFRIKAGSVYTLLVQWQDFAPVSAAARIPEQPLFNWSDTFGNDDGLNILAVLNDREQEDHYLFAAECYGLRLVTNPSGSVDTFPVLRELAFKTNINDALNFSFFNSEGSVRKYALFDDLRFNGRTQLINCVIDRNDIEPLDSFLPIELRLRMCNISMDYYTYLKTSAYNLPLLGILQGSTSNVHSNVLSGLGILAGQNCKESVIQLR